MHERHTSGRDCDVRGIETSTGLCALRGTEEACTLSYRCGAGFCVVGARPNFMKAKPVVDAVDRCHADVVLVHTGQHYDRLMSAVFFDEIGLRPPDHWLGAGSVSHAEQTARVMTALEPLVDAVRPDVVVVFGDVNSTAAGALVAAKSPPDWPTSRPASGVAIGRCPRRSTASPRIARRCGVGKRPTESPRCFAMCPSRAGALRCPVPEPAPAPELLGREGAGWRGRRQVSRRSRGLPGRGKVERRRGW